MKYENPQAFLEAMAWRATVYCPDDLKEALTKALKLVDERRTSEGGTQLDEPGDMLTIRKMILAHQGRDGSPATTVVLVRLLLDGLRPSDATHVGDCRETGPTVSCHSPDCRRSGDAKPEFPAKVEAAFVSAYAHFLRQSWGEITEREADETREGCIVMFEQVKQLFKERRSEAAPSGSLDAIGILTRDRDEWKRRALRTAEAPLDQRISTSAESLFTVDPKGAFVCTHGAFPQRRESPKTSGQPEERSAAARPSTGNQSGQVGPTGLAAATNSAPNAGLDSNIIVTGPIRSNNHPQSADSPGVEHWADAIFEEVDTWNRERKGGSERASLGVARILEGARRETIEACARICEKYVSDDGGVEALNEAALECAQLIRASLFTRNAEDKP